MMYPDGCPFRSRTLDDIVVHVICNVIYLFQYSYILLCRTVNLQTEGSRRDWTVGSTRRRSRHSVVEGGGRRTQIEGLDASTFPEPSPTCRVPKVQGSSVAFLPQFPDYFTIYPIPDTLSVAIPNIFQYHMFLFYPSDHFWTCRRKSARATRGCLYHIKRRPSRSSIHRILDHSFPPKDSVSHRIRFKPQDSKFSQSYK
ncbi:hypothetical protein BD779DRAFT_668129 [Infundibulicybe gibba]|nr:hypothetical protein BD779DRAFT_668129 [Infundibulicybe gibba]